MAHPALPEGESLRRAVRWISERREATPSAPLIQLIEEASRQFDLSPKEGNFLVNFFTQPAEK
jgi:hypothetical protein